MDQRKKNYTIKHQKKSYQIIMYILNIYYLYSGLITYFYLNNNISYLTNKYFKILKIVKYKIVPL